MSAVPIGGDLMPGRPGRGLGLFLGATAVGRGVTTIPATRLYDAHGMGACALLAAVLALAAAGAMGAAGASSAGRSARRRLSRGSRW